MSLSTIAPAYANDRMHASSRAALIPGSVISGGDVETVVEHEHHHVHHHIDHGSVVNNQLALSSRPRGEYAYDDMYDNRERRHGSSVSIVSSSHHNHTHGSRERHHRHHNHRSSGGSRYSRSDMDLSNVGARRSGELSVTGTSDWTIIDVPPGTRRITLDTTGGSISGSVSGRESETAINTRYNGVNGVRRSRGLASELWTEMTKDLVTREAIEELGYPFEETDHFYYIFEYLHREQITELIELTADIRHERVKDLEFSRLANSGPACPPSGTHYIDERPEVVYTDERTTRRQRKYYY